jgi:phytanoyl-CoA hydroxylase
MDLKLQQYQSLGYSEFPQFLSPEKITLINAVIDKLQETLTPSDEVFDESGTGKIKQIQYLYKYDPIFIELLTQLETIAIQLTGESQLDCLNMQLFEKHPDISKPTRAHQDNGYFKISPPIALTFWLSLDKIDEENGAIYYAPMTHLTPTRNHQRYHKQTTFRMRSGVPGLSLCLKEHPEETDKVMITNPGDLLVHNCNLVHRAGKNLSADRRRRAIGIVFIPKVCVPDKRLVDYANQQLREDIELQKIKDPELYKALRKQFEHLY